MFARLTGVSSAARNYVGVEALLHTYSDRVGKLGISKKLGDGIDNTFSREFSSIFLAGGAER